MGIFKPRRGKKSTMASTATTGKGGNIVLAAGEMFLEYPDTGIGTGRSRIKVGDGSTAYSSLPYAINLDEIKVAGRNLILNVGNYTESNPAVVTSKAKDNCIINLGSGMMYSNHEFSGGETILLQAKSNVNWTKTHGGSDTNKGVVGFWCYWCNGLDNAKKASYVNPQFVAPTTTGSTVYLKTITVPTKSDSYSNGLYLCLGLNTYSDGSTSYTFKFWDIKISLGNTDDGWSMAPEDIQAITNNIECGDEG